MILLVRYVYLIILLSLFVSSDCFIVRNNYRWSSNILVHPAFSGLPDGRQLTSVQSPVYIAETKSAVNVVMLPSGVQYFDVVEGSSLLGEAKEGKTVQFQWVLRKSNGYFVSSSKIEGSSNQEDEPFIYKVGNTKRVIRGLDEGIRGMKVGGIRRVIVPADLAYTAGVDDDSPGPVPRGFGPKRQIASNVKEFWIFEVKLVKARE